MIRDRRPLAIGICVLLLLAGPATGPAIADSASVIGGSTDGSAETEGEIDDIVDETIDESSLDEPVNESIDDSAIAESNDESPVDENATDNVTIDDEPDGALPSENRSDDSAIDDSAIEGAVDDVDERVERSIETIDEEALEDATDGPDAVLETSGDVDPTVDAGLEVGPAVGRIGVSTSIAAGEDETAGGDAGTSEGDAAGDESERAPITASGNESAPGDASDESEDVAAPEAGGDADGGFAPPDGAGAGVAAGAGLTGLALLARRVGAAAALSPGSAGAGGSTFSALASLVREWGLRLVGLLGYQRYSDDDPLEHETRAAIYEHVASSPGTYLAEISEETDVPMGTARYHLRVLEFENLVSRVSTDGRRRYVPVGTDAAELEAALNDDATAAVLSALAAAGPSSVSDLAERLDRDPSTISHHLSRLADDGLVERERDGRAVLNRLADGVAEAVRAREAVRADDETTAERPVAGRAD